MPPLDPPLAPEPADAPIRRHDPVTGRHRREGVVAQGVADGARGAAQVGGEGEVGRVVAKGDLAEGQEDAFAEGG